MRRPRVSPVLVVLCTFTLLAPRPGRADPALEQVADDQQQDGDAGGWTDKYGPGADGSATAGGDAGAAIGAAWPRQLTQDNTTVYLYQPQVDTWDRSTNQLQARAAVSVQPATAGTPTYGVIWLTASTQADEAAGTVALTNVRLTKASFPDTDDGGAANLALLRSLIPAAVARVSLATLQSDLAISRLGAAARVQPVKNDPPRIIFSPTRAMLILVDGEPVVRPVPGTSLGRVINTKSLILRDANGHYFLYLIDRWLQAVALGGPWSALTAPSDDLEKAKATAVAAHQVDLGDQPGSEARMAVDFGSFPSVFVSTVPTALIQTQGEPRFEPVEGTQLKFATNTFDDIFSDPPASAYYVLISGRWFRAPSLTGGPWTWVSAAALPADFRRIPADHVAGDVLASVPGTPQAQMAVVDNGVPRTATVDRASTTLSVTYDGEPQFRPIEGTSLRYAANAATPVIAAADAYYAVANGVWFQASAPTGPWSVATSVPDDVYAIPPSSPVSHVSYVTIYGATDEEVSVGYTPGYFGALVGPDDVVVYGTGWGYDPWIGTYWIGAPQTYGLGAALAWDAVYGYNWAFAGGGWVVPWWGPRAWGWGTAVDADRWSVARYDAYGRWARGVRSDWSAARGDARFGGWQSALYAGDDGRVYRRAADGWQYRGGGDWRRGIGGPGLERDAMARFGGGFRGGFGGGFRGGGRR